MPKTDTNGKVTDRRNALRSDKSEYNYGTNHNGVWDWMNHGKGEGKVEDRKVYCGGRSDFASITEFPYTLVCSQCLPCPKEKPKTEIKTATEGGKKK